MLLISDFFLNKNTLMLQCIRDIPISMFIYSVYESCGKTGMTTDPRATFLFSKSLKRKQNFPTWIPCGKHIFTAGIFSNIFPFFSLRIGTIIFLSNRYDVRYLKCESCPFEFLIRIFERLFKNRDDAHHKILNKQFK